MLKKTLVSKGLAVWVTLTELINCIHTLGYKPGTRYFKIMQQCKKNPARIEDWASACQAEAMNEKNPDIKAALTSWAHLLRKTIWNYNQKATPKK